MRTYVVTGSASGIGAATRATLESRGDRVVGVDRHDAEITLDLGEPAERQSFAARVRALGVDALDGVLPAAGLSAGLAPADRVLAVNFFGAVATVSQLRPLLLASEAPRVCFISSIGLLSCRDDDLTERCLAGDESGALELLAADPSWVYERSKRAVSTWVRRHAVEPEWVGSGILVNAIAPGLIETHMSEAITRSPEALERLFAA